MYNSPVKELEVSTHFMLKKPSIGQDLGSIPPTFLLHSVPAED
jgi:hypothetical protein